MSQDSAGRLRRRRRPHDHRDRGRRPQGAHVEFLDCAPEPVGAIKGGRAAFMHVALAYSFGRGHGRADRDATPRDREVLREHFGALMEAFEDEHGAFCRSYFARDAYAAAVLTDRDEISIVLGSDLPHESRHLVALLLRCEQIAYAAWHRLAAYDRRLCQNMIFSVIEELLRRLDRQASLRHDGAGPAANGGPPARTAGPPRGDEAGGRRGRPDDELDELREHLEDAEEFMLRCAARRAQIRYLKGMLAGTAAVGLVIAAAAAVAGLATGIGDLVGQLLVVATSGALGAFVSVLARMTSGTFRMNLPTLSYEMRSTDLLLMGILRPLIGVIFALAGYVLVVSALLPMAARDTGTEIFLYAAVGFLAGFSERVAQDMFVRSGQGLAGVMGDSPSTGPSAGLAPPPGAQPPRSPRRPGRASGR
jgi:hypothetical protein